jgi:hypothetical protein
MANKITIASEKLEGRMDEIDQWLRGNAGQGSARYGGKKGSVSHWLNGDDWIYYEEYTMSAAEDRAIDSNYIFVFRSEAVAVEFALRFA